MRTRLLSCLALLVGVASAADSLYVRLVGRLDFQNPAFGVVANGDYAYVANSYALRVISVADPSNPIEVGHCSTPGSCQCVAVVGDYAYAGDSDSGLAVVSVADRAHPTEIGHCATLGGAVGVAVAGSHAYVAGYMGGFRVVSISDPSHPSEVGNSGPGLANAVDVNGDKAYVGADFGGVRVISVSDPANPFEVGYYSLPEGVSGVVAAGEYIYLANSFDGLQILQYFESGIEESHQPLAQSRKLAATVIRNLPAGAVAFDAMGRRVVNLTPGIYFMWEEPLASSSKPQAVRKVVVTR